MVVLALVSVPVIVAPWLLDLPGAVAASLEVVDWVIWAAFTFQFLVRISLTDHRLRFAIREWPDVLIILLPLLRPLRILRSARVLRVLGVVRLAAFLAEAGRTGARMVARSHIGYVVVAALAMIVAAAALIVAVEGQDGAGIETFGDGLWWAVTTVTTVGYGDLYPQTPVGRGVAALLMSIGIATFGVVTAKVAAFFVEEQADPTIHAKLDEILRRLDELESRSPLDARSGDPTPGT